MSILVPKSSNLHNKWPKNVLTRRKKFLHCFLIFHYPYIYFCHYKCSAGNAVYDPNPKKSKKAFNIKQSCYYYIICMLKIIASIFHHLYHDIMKFVA